MKIITATDITEQPSDKITKISHPWKINTNNYLMHAADTSLLLDDKGHP
jgi:hypothetical protein